MLGWVATVVVGALITSMATASNNLLWVVLNGAPVFP